MEKFSTEYFHKLANDLKFDLSDEEIEKYKVCDEHDQKSLTVPEENTKIQLGFGDIYFYFYAIDSEDALRYLNITQPENH